MRTKDDRMTVSEDPRACAAPTLRPQIACSSDEMLEVVPGRFSTLNGVDNINSGTEGGAACDFEN
jgi:hypothetical protein